MQEKNYFYWTLCLEKRLILCAYCLHSFYIVVDCRVGRIDEKKTLKKIAFKKGTEKLLSL